MSNMENNDVDYLVISYYFPPRLETSGLVVARKIMEKNLNVDVIQSAYDESSDFNEIINKHINNRFPIDIKTKPDYIPFIFKYIDLGLKAIKKNYKKVYSRSYIYSNHFLALEYKFKNPNAEWTAEFSDPLLLNLYTGEVKNYPRAILDNPDYINKLNEKIEKFNEVSDTDFKALDNPSNTFFMAEYLTFIFADKIIFTNENQREVMLSVYDSELREFVMDKSKLEAHPTIDKEFYNFKDCEIRLDNNCINIAYFGTYYYIRHFESLFYAFEALNHKYKDKIKLYFFTSRAELLKVATGSLKISNNIIIEKPLKYFEFLNATTKFDILLINDTITKGHFKVNPYLPSKYSDYIGSGSDIWGICEEDSILSKKELKYKSSMTDYQSSCEVLIDILNEYGYEDLDYYFEDNIFEKRINELNWRFGFEFDDKKKYYTRYCRLKDKNKKLKDEKQVLIDKKEKLKAKNESLMEKNINLEKENELLKAKYDGIINSNSWKITKPLRKLKNSK
ncbi:hypothetical protein [Methanobrevibacter gottschalkii]|nr:hypothetical protein [Methanobrevibacter gottschalkii]